MTDEEMAEKYVKSVMVQCPYCKTYLYKSCGFFFGTVWEEPYWGFKTVKKESE